MTAAGAQVVRETNAKRWIYWIGWAVSLWPAFVVGSSATWKLTHNAWYVKEFARIGWPESALALLAGLQLGAIILFLIPPTAVLGCVILTGYLGGAIAAYTRIGEPYPVLVPLSTSMIAWLGLWLRDERLRALLPIRRRTTAFTLFAALLLLASGMHAQVTLNSVRIGAKDTVALAKFYEAAFGMQEVNRIDAPTGPEVFVNFGASTEAAKANKSEPIVIMHRDSDDLKDPIAHVILNVKDMNATVAAIKAAGGSMTGDPRPFRNTGVVIGIAMDPAGNRIEMIQRP